jgi:hypothetical protein
MAALRIRNERRSVPDGSSDASGGAGNSSSSSVVAFMVEFRGVHAAG